MTNQEILTKAIEKAIADGWSPVKKEFEWRVIDTYPSPFLSCMVAIVDMSAFDGDNVVEKKFTVNDVIFNHDFAKALWEDAPMPDDDDDDPPTLGMYSGGGYEGYGDYIRFNGEPWQYHLQQMVIADDPIKYLADHL